MKGYKLYRVLGVVGAVCLPVAATAALLELTTFKKDEVISSSAMNVNFAALNEKIDALETQLAERAALGQFCGTTTTPEKGNFGSYEAADELCATDAPDCTADGHLCTAPELLLHRPPQTVNGWFASATATNVGPADCDGFRSSAVEYSGVIWSEGRAISLNCSSSYVLLCCH